MTRRIPIVPAPAAPVEAPAPSLRAPPPLALYVHFPWCIRKCPYCDFNSHPVRGEIPQGQYVDALLADLETALPQIWGRRIHSLFIGGGTPSLIEPGQLGRLLDGVRALGNLVPGAEITLEANPGAADAGRFAAFRDAGVTRLSVGVQSFDDRMLAAIGRIHDGAEARRAVEAALACFERVNLDLMYGLPGQDPARLASDLDAALDYRPGHLSCYHLTLEPNTEFHATPPPLPDEDCAGEMQESIEARLAMAGYEHYEVSAYALAGEACRHNLNYWRFGDYLGIGAGAHGKITQTEQGLILRTRTSRQPDHYLQRAGDGFAEQAAIAESELAIEYLLNVLRLREGFAVSAFEAATGLGFEHIEKQVLSLTARGLLAFDQHTIRPTAKGEQFLNSVLEAFL